MKSKFILFGIMFLAASFAGAQKPLKFDFGSGKAAKGYTPVTAADVYTEQKGYGFEPGAEITCFAEKGKNVLLSDYCAGAQPFYFSVAVAEGNYKVKITFGNQKEATAATVKAELRRLMLDKAEIRAGKSVTKEIIVNVRRPGISTGGEVRLKEREKTMEIWAWDEKLTLEFNGSRPTVAALEIVQAEVPTIFLLGDSTVSDQPREPYASWGQMLTGFFKPEIAVANHAQSGESLRSSLSARRLDKVLSQMKRGDFLLIQYGHNDMKEKGEGVGAFTTYKASLKKFVTEARKKGGVPILLTPMHRRTFDENGKIVNSHGDYPEAVRQVAGEESVELIDLNIWSKDFYEALGREKSALAFAPNDGTHHNNYGSFELAKCIIEAIRRQKLPLAKYLIKDLPAFDPKKPDSVESVALAPSPQLTDLKPLGN